MWKGHSCNSTLVYIEDKNKCNCSAAQSKYYSHFPELNTGMKERKREERKREREKKIKREEENSIEEDGEEDIHFLNY